MHDRLHAHRGEQHGRRHRRAEDPGAEVPRGDVPQHARHDPPSLERLKVRPRGPLAARRAGHVAVGLAAQHLPRPLLELKRRHRELRPFTDEAPPVDLVLEVREQLLQGGIGVGHG
jgi:hypothetical protein